VVSIHCYASATGVHVSPILKLPSFLPPHPIPLGCPSAPTSFECSVSCIELGLMIYFTYTCFKAILSNHATLTFSQSLKFVFISASLLLSCIGDHYHLSKFHIYALIHCIGVFFPTYITHIGSFLLSREVSFSPSFSIA